MKSRIAFVLAKFAERIATELKKFVDMSTFRGAVAAAVVALLIGTYILNSCDTFKDENIVPDDIIHSNSTPDDTVPDDIAPDNTAPDSTAPDDIAPDNTAPDNTAPDDIAPDNTAPDDTAPDIISFDITSNGTMPRGTNPKVVPELEQMEKILTNIQSLAIGCSKDWVDDKLGIPYASNIVKVTETGRVLPYTNENNMVGELLEYIYIFFDTMSAQIYFDTTDNSCKAFFVTLMEDTLDFDIVMPEVYLPLVANKPLGEFTFSEIAGEPGQIYGYVSQGVARTFYGEQYYYGGRGNYQDFYFTVLDYGMLNSLSEFIHFLSNVQLDIYPAKDVDGYSSSDLLMQERGQLYPNTYGISSLNQELTFDLISYYIGFDSLPLRGN